jgi:hypothetical protein
MRSFRRLLQCVFLIVLMQVVAGVGAHAQVAASAQGSEVEELRQTVRDLALRVSALEQQLHQQQGVAAASAAPVAGGATGAVAAVRPSNNMVADAAPVTSGVTSGVTAPIAIAPVGGQNAQAPSNGSGGAGPLESVLPAQLPGGATLNYYVDGYYGYDFNHPIGRVQYLRAYDVLSNAFSLNQAGIVLDLDPNVEEGRRYGVRLDLQEYLSGVWDVCVSAGSWANGGFWEVVEFDWD